MKVISIPPGGQAYQDRGGLLRSSRWQRISQYAPQAQLDECGVVVFTFMTQATNAEVAAK